MQGCRCYLLPYLVLCGHSPHGNSQVISQSSSSIVKGGGLRWRCGTAEPIRAECWYHTHFIHNAAHLEPAYTTKKTPGSKQCLRFDEILNAIDLLQQLLIITELHHNTASSSALQSFRRNLYLYCYSTRMAEPSTLHMMLVFYYIHLIIIHRDSNIVSLALSVSCFLLTY